MGYVLGNTIHVGPKCVVTILRQKCTHRRLFPQLKVSQNSDGVVGATGRRPHIPMLTVFAVLMMVDYYMADSGIIYAPPRSVI